MMALLRKIHRWVGLLIGLQVLLWLISGLGIALLDPAKVSGQQWRQQALDKPASLPVGAVLEPYQLPDQYLSGALAVSLVEHQGDTVYWITHEDGETLLNAVNGSLLVTGETKATELAQRDFSGDGEVVSITRGSAPERETRNHNGTFWKVDFSDDANTSIYVSAATGEILERRNRHWRAHDFFWMLHIMDYGSREDFNNPLVIGVALVSAWLGLSGFILLFGSFSYRDFRFPNRPGRSQTDG